MERAGIPRKLAMEISGHKTESIYRRYDIVSSRDLRNAATKMEAYQETFGDTPKKFGDNNGEFGDKGEFSKSC